MFSYKKQSSGKDLSSRSSSELDCIFGWNKINQNNIQQAKEAEEEEKEAEQISENQYVTSKQSIHDYFKQKSKNRLLNTEASAVNDDSTADEPKKKKKKKQHEEDNPYPGSNIVELDGYAGWQIDSSVDEIVKKKEKQKKRKK